MDSNGLSDPYVIVKLGKKVFKTKVKKKTLNPFWNEKFEMGEWPEDSSPIVLRVMDKDLAFDDFIGEVRIGKLRPGEMVEGTHVLSGNNSSQDKYRGQIQVQIKYHAEGEDDSQFQKGYASKRAHKSTPNSTVQKNTSIQAEKVETSTFERQGNTSTLAEKVKTPTTEWERFEQAMQSARRSVNTDDWVKKRFLTFFAPCSSAVDAPHTPIHTYAHPYTPTHTHTYRKM